MAINLSDNIKISGPLPIDSRYFNNLVPYTGVSEVNSIIDESLRYTGLTVNINGIEYWYKDGVGDGDLVEKKYDSEIPSGDFVTGATNIGYFSGTTGVQILPIDNLVNNDYDGNYRSLYNYFYRGTDGNIHIGTPSDGILKRGYVKLTVPVKSWIWNEYTGSSNLLGWILIDGNIEDQLGTFQNGVTYYNGTTTFPYTATTWTTGMAYNNASNVVVNTVTGGLTTGSTLTIGGRPFAEKNGAVLDFRTIVSETPNILGVRDDETFIYLSGITAVLSASNVGTGANVLSGQTDTELFFRTIKGSGDTTVTTVGNEIVIYASISGQTSITGATNIGLPEASGGTSVFDSRDNKTLLFKNLVGSGDTIVSQSGDTVVIFTDAGEQTYNLQSPSVIPLGGICAGTVLTGKTAFELFEELLVPELFGTITAPSRSLSMIPSSGTLVEIGCLLSTICVTSNFNRGCINPQYCSASDKRSGLPNTYTFTGEQIAGSYACTDLSVTKCVTGFTVPIGTTSWSASVSYDCGVQPLGSKGTPYCTPLPSGTTTAASGNIVGVYPLFATTSNITTLTQQGLQNMSTANNILISLVAESGGNKQKFEIPCAWLGSPTNRNLCGVCQWNTVSCAWEYPGGSAATSLTLWTPSSATETVQGNSIGYCQYTYNSVDRSAVCIRLVF